MYQKDINKSKAYNFYFIPQTSFEVNAFVYKGLALGGGFSLQYTKQNMNFKNFNISLIGWSVGPSIYYHFRLGRIFVPYLGFKYNYFLSGFNFNNTGTLKDDQQRHSIEPIGGLTIMMGKVFGLSLSYSYVYKFNSFSLKSIEEKGLHKAAIAFKIYL